MYDWWISSDQQQMYEESHCEGAAQCPTRLSARRSAATIQLAVAVELCRGTRSRGEQGMFGRRERRALGEEPPRKGLKTRISFSPSIVECAAQLMRHGRLSSEIQAAGADVFDRVWASPSGPGETRLHKDADAQGTLNSHGTWLKCEGATAGSCAWACNSIWDE